MARKVTITLTIPQATELELCAGNGYGDGDFYEGIGPGKRQKERAYLEAIWKLNSARHAAQDAIKAKATMKGGR